MVSVFKSLHSRAPDLGLGFRLLGSGFGACSV